MDKIFKKTVSEWCGVCVYGPEPNKNCRVCFITDLSDDENAPIGKPSEFKERSK